MNKKKELLVQIMWELAGSIFYAIGIYNFALQAEFPMTGFSGISIILYRLFNISIGLSTVLLNIPVAILCCKLLGRKFFVSSIRCMLLSSFIVDYIAPVISGVSGRQTACGIVHRCILRNRLCNDLYKKFFNRRS